MLKHWHTKLSMPVHTKQWYRLRFKEERLEQKQSTSLLNKLSETADVLYSKSTMHIHLFQSSYFNTFDITCTFLTLHILQGISRASTFPSFIHLTLNQYLEHDGYPLPTKFKPRLHSLLAYIYMLAKYSSRWSFYRYCEGKSSSNGKKSIITEVVNPKKDAKIVMVAKRWNIEDVDKFLKVAQKVRRVWPLFP